MLPKLITFIEAAYIVYMFFLFKTKYAFNDAIFDKNVQSWGSAFVHNTGHYENKICLFGKYMAILAILLGLIRLYAFYSCKQCIGSIILWTIIFDVICCILAYVMNLNAFVYILPLIVSEIGILYIFANKKIIH